MSAKRWRSAEVCVDEDFGVGGEVMASVDIKPAGSVHHEEVRAFGDNKRQAFRTLRRTLNAMLKAVDAEIAKGKRK